jgi:hypothetical protein
MCRPLSRRELLRYGALVAATFATKPVLSARTASATSLTAVPMDLELVTVTDTQACITWFTGDPTIVDEFRRPVPVPTDTTLWLGRSPVAMEPITTGGDTAYHRVDLRGLEPGTTYYYRAESGGRPATSGAVAYGESPATGRFTTLVPPPGRERLRVAWINDLHWGESVSGLAIGSPVQFPPGFPVDPADPYWRFMATAAVAEARAAKAHLMFVNGDLTSEAEPGNVAAAKSLLDTFGAYRHSYFVTRGNHDRAHAGTAYDRCRPVAGDLHDCMDDVFFPDGAAHFSVGSRGRRFIGLDSVSNPDGYGNISDAEFGFLEAELGRHGGEPTFVMFHHPATAEAAATIPGGPAPNGAYALPAGQSDRLIRLLSAHDQVVGVYNGHTHRNYTSSDPRSGALPFMEFGATKEYPGGYAILRLFDGGYMVNFWKVGGPSLRSDLAEKCRMWSQRSRGEYLGLYPEYTLGRFTDRNRVVVHG